MSKHRADVPVEDFDLAQTIKNLVHDELAAMVADVEFRLGRMAELERRVNARLEGEVAQAMTDVPDGSVYVEDIVSGRHAITGYTLTANSPSAGSIAWTSVHVVYNGVDYKIADASTALRYTWFVKPASYTPGVSADVNLVSSNTKPTQGDLGVGGALIFVNNAGTPTSALESSIPAAVQDGAVDGGAIATGAIDDTKISGVTAGKVTGVLGTANIPSLDASKIASGTLGTAQIPALDASKITTGTLGATQIPSLDASKITTGTLGTTQIPNLDAAKITSGTLGVTTIPNLDAAKITSGTIPDARIASGISASKVNVGTLPTSAVPALDASKITTGAFGTAQIPSLDASKITTGTLGTGQIPNLDAAKITSGTLAGSLIGSGTVTASKLAVAQHMVY